MGLVRSGIKQLQSMVFQYPSSRLFQLPRTRFNYRNEVGDGTGSSTVMAPILWVARTFPEAPLVIERREQEDFAPIDDHGLAKLVRRPNPYFSGSVLWMATVLSFMVDGNAYWIKIRNGAGNVIQLWWVPHWSIAPIAPTDGSSYISGYQYEPQGQLLETSTGQFASGIQLDNDDVVHFRFGLDGDDMRKGLSPLKSVLREVFTDDEAANFSAALLRNMGVPGIVISPEHDQPINPDDAEATKEYVQRRFSGDNRGQPLAMSGRTKVDQFGFSPKELNLKELRRVPEERVTAVLGLPAMIAGLGAGLDRSTFSNYGEARRAAYENNIIPTQSIFGEEIHHQLLPDFERNIDQFRSRFDRSEVAVLQEDENERAQRWNTMVTGAFATRAEARRAFDLETSDSDDVYLQGLSIVERPRTAPIAEIGSGEPDPEPNVASRKVKQQDEAGRALAELFDISRIRLSDVMADELQEDFKVLGDRAAEAFDESGLGKDNEDDAETVFQGLGLSSWITDYIKQTFEGHYRRVAQKVVEDINEVMNLGIEITDEVMRHVVETGGKRVGMVDIEGDTRRAIFTALADGRSNGEHPRELRERIREYVPQGRFTNAGSRYRSEMIARTETKFAQNKSSVEAYKGSDSVNGVVAYDNRIGHDDADCMDRDGQVFSFDEADDIMAEEHPNGTLSFAPALPEQVSA